MTRMPCLPISHRRTISDRASGLGVQKPKQLLPILPAKRYPDAHAGSLRPILDRAAIKALLGFGVFSWLQALSGIVFGQTDRLFLGLSAGAVAVASYARCTQLAQPIYGLAVSSSGALARSS